MYLNSHAGVISIHAPTRGATAGKLKVRPNEGISIHAPTRGATIPWPQPHRILLFQSTLPRGERLFRVPDMVRILIHFNPRSHEGSDRNRGLFPLSRYAFQSTLPRGERPFHGRSRTGYSYFNPRSHEGSDCF